MSHNHPIFTKLDPDKNTGPYNIGPYKLSLIIVLLSLFCLLLADLSVTTINPLAELKRLIAGAFSPSLSAIDVMFDAIGKTISYALLAVSISAIISFLLAPYFNYKWVRILCTLIRSIHEIFWALLLLQIFGLHPLTGLLAITIPYTGVLTKIYAEIIEENQPALVGSRQQPHRFSNYFYIQLPSAWATIVHYTRYRFECALRSSTVLGFIGLPTLGYYLEVSLLEGQYSNVWGILSLLVFIIVTMRWWMRKTLLPFYIIGAIFTIGDWHNFVISRYIFSDMLPNTWHDQGLQGLIHWFSQLALSEGLTGIINTLVLSQVALFFTGLLALLGYPLICRHFTNYHGRAIGTLLLTITRSVPEYLLALICLIIFGPSMLPAIIALALHNAAIVAQLTGVYANHLQLNTRQLPAVENYFYQITPQLYGQFLAFLFYRWEVIIRETAILGLLGIYTLGFYIDSAFQDIRLDKALALIILTALLNIAIDGISSWVRSKVRRDSADRLTPIM